MSLRAALVALALAAIGAPACTSGEAHSGPAPITFVAASPTEGASVFMRAEPPNVLLPNRVVVDVVARGAADLHGAAFRILWDPSALGFVEARSGTPWSKQVLSLAKEGSPGELAVVWSEKGEVGIDANGETVLGTLAFDVRGRKGTSLMFKPERSQLVDKKSVPLTTSWSGGQLTAR